MVITKDIKCNLEVMCEISTMVRDLIQINLGGGKYYIGITPSE